MVSPELVDIVVREPVEDREGCLGKALSHLRDRTSNESLDPVVSETRDSGDDDMCKHE
jgi:hypothetical protein